MLEEDCGHIREGHRDRESCEERTLWDVEEAMYVADSPFTRCLIDAAALDPEWVYPAWPVRVKLSSIVGVAWDDQSFLRDSAHRQERSPDTCSAECRKKAECWHLHLENLNRLGASGLYERD